MPEKQEPKKTATEAAAEEGRIPNVVDPGEADQDFPTPQATNEIPEWVDLPADLKIPRGTSIGFIQFLGAWTVVPHKGDRQCVVWPLTDLDERLAYSRIANNPASAANELAKQMIRSVDGVKVDAGARPGAPGCVDDFWREIGPKCRGMVIRYYSRTHNMSSEETAYFLENCVVVRTMS